MTFDDDAYGDQSADGFCLAEIPDFQGLLPKSHNAGVPVFCLTDLEIDETGTVLEGFKSKRDQFGAQFSALSDRIIEILDNA